MPNTFAALLLAGALALQPVLATTNRAAGDPNAAFAAVAARYFSDRMDLDPLSASFLLADRKYDGRLAITIAPAEITRATALNRRVAKQVAALPAAQLRPAERLSRDLLTWEVQTALEGDAFPGHLMPIDHFGGLPVLLASLGAGDQGQPLETPADYANYLKRLERLPVFNEQAIANMREGMRRGYTQPRPLIDAALPAFERLAEPDFDKSPFADALKRLPAAFTPAERKRITDAYRTAFTRAILPSMQRLRTFLAGPYRSACRTTAGYSALPDGAAFYAYMVRFHTTTDMTPREIHAIGLAEVDRIRREIAAVQAHFGFQGSITEFLRWHAEEPRFRPFKTAQDMVDVFTAANARVEPLLGRVFGRLPKQPLELRPIPELQRAWQDPYYNVPAPDGSRPGIFFVGAPEPERFSGALVTALLLHEGQPGHHFHAAVMRELDLPAFRKYGWNTAFGEGWALYAESLGRELGPYDDPNQYLGFLKLELLRAVRLVADTGLHALGWTREQSIAYMMETQGATETDARVATHRYMAVPGQALAYKIGALKIQALRQRAQASLGDAFSLAAFHDLVLSQGTVPLAVLERLVDAWIAAGGKTAGS